MLSHGNSSDLFSDLHRICIDLKDIHSLPMTIPFDHKILAMDHVDVFLKMLGFKRDKTRKQWRCDENTVVDVRLIEVAITECQHCLDLIQQKESTLELVYNHRKQQEPLPKTATLAVVQQSESLVVEDTDQFHEEEEDEDYVQLYELIWGITHPQNENLNAKHVLLLTYPLVTDAKYVDNVIVW